MFAFLVYLRWLLLCVMYGTFNQERKTTSIYGLESVQYTKRKGEVSSFFGKSFDGYVDQLNIATSFFLSS